MRVVGRHRNLPRRHSTINLRRKHRLHREAMIDNSILQHINIEGHLECPRTHWCHLSEHNVLRNAVTIILLADSCRLHQDFDRLLEGAPHKSPRVCTIDSMARNGHERPAVRHQIAQQGKMPVVDVGTVEFNDTAQLFQNRRACGLDTENIEDFNATVGICPLEVNAVDAHDRLQIDAIRLQHPLFLQVSTDCTIRGNCRLVLLRQEDTVNALNAAQADRVQHCSFKLSQEDVLIRCTLFFLVAAQDTTTNDELVRVIFAPDDE